MLDNGSEVTLDTQRYHCVSSGCSSIIFKIRQDKKMCMGVSTLKGKRKEEILIYGLLQLFSLIHHAVPVHAAVTPRQGASLPLHAVSHSFSCLGKKLYAPLRPQQPPSNALLPRFTVTLLHPETHHDRITPSTKVMKYGRARYVQTNTSCYSPSNSLLIPNSLTECSVCQLICFS